MADFSYHLQGLSGEFHRLQAENGALVQNVAQLRSLLEHHGVLDEGHHCSQASSNEDCLYSERRARLASQEEELREEELCDDSEHLKGEKRLEAVPSHFTVQPRFGNCPSDGSSNPRTSRSMIRLKNAVSKTARHVQKYADPAMWTRRSLRKRRKDGSLSTQDRDRALYKRQFKRVQGSEGFLTVAGIIEIRGRLGLPDDGRTHEAVVELLSCFGSNRSEKDLSCADVAEAQQALANNLRIHIDEFLFLMMERFMSKSLCDMQDFFREEARVQAEEEAKAVVAARSTRAREWQPSGALGFLWEFSPVAVIILNAISLGFTVSHEGALGWEIVEFLTLIFFLFEFLIKLKCLGWRTYFGGALKYWNCFDFLCLCIGCADVLLTALMNFTNVQNMENFGALMLLKMIRVARVARLLRAVRMKMLIELKIILEGIFGGIRVIAWAVVLLFVLIYVTGIMMRLVIGDDIEDLPEFDTLETSMFTVFRCFTDGCNAFDGYPLQERLRQRFGIFFFAAFFFMFIFVTMGLFNLVMATFINDVIEKNVARKQHEIGDCYEEMQLALRDTVFSLYYNDETTNILQGGIDTRMEIVTKGMFNIWLNDQFLLSTLENVEIDTSNRRQLFDAVDVNLDDEVSIDELVDGLMRLRGPICKADISAIRLKVRYMIKLMEKSALPLLAKIASFVEAIAANAKLSL